MRLPSREIRGWLIQAGTATLKTTFPAGYSMRFSLPTVRTTSKFDPSGDQSAHSTFSSTSRGAVQPVSGVRANVPNAPKNPGRVVGFNEIAISPFEEMPSRST